MTESTYAASPPFRGVRDVRARLLPVGIVAAALLVGVAAAVQPILAVVLMLGLAFVPIVFTRPIVGLAVVLFMSFLEEYSAMSGAVSLTKILGAMLVLAWVAIVATAGRTHRASGGLLSSQPVLGAALAVFVAWACVSLVWAEAPGLAQSSVLRYGLNFVLFPIALVAIRTRRHVLWVAAVFIAGALAAAALGLLSGTESAAGDEGRLKGAGLNPNQLGSYLVVAMVLAVALAANRRWSPLTRSFALAVAGLCAVAMFMTVSRGALVGMGVALLVAPLVAGPGRRARVLVLVVAAVVGTYAWYAAVAPASAVDRITHPERAGGSGREDLWRVGWRMVEDHPIRGVGAGNFPEASIHYLLRPGATQRDAFIVDDKKVAHNIYLTVLSELGIVGLSLFVVIVAACLRCALRAARMFAQRGDTMMELLSRALFISLASMLVVGFFSSALYSKQFWLLLATAPALLAMAERAEPATRATVTRLWRPQPLPSREAG